MLKKTMTFQDYNDNTVTKDFYFNLTKAELIELEVSTGTQEGFASYLQKIITANNGRDIIDTFKRIILMAYGQKSEDGVRFIKSEALREEFSQTEAYSDLFMELSTDAGAAAAFINGIVPKGLASQLEANSAKTNGDSNGNLGPESGGNAGRLELAQPPLEDAVLAQMSQQELIEYFKNRS